MINKLKKTNMIKGQLPTLQKLSKFAINFKFGEKLTL